MRITTGKYTVNNPTPQVKTQLKCFQCTKKPLNHDTQKKMTQKNMNFFEDKEKWFTYL